MEYSNSDPISVESSVTIINPKIKLMKFNKKKTILGLIFQPANSLHHIPEQLDLFSTHIPFQSLVQSAMHRDVSGVIAGVVL